MKRRKHNSVVHAHGVNSHCIVRSATKSCALKGKMKKHHRKTINNIFNMVKMINKNRIFENSPSGTYSQVM